MSLTIFTDRSAKNNGASTCRLSIDRNWIPAMTRAEIGFLQSLGPDNITPVQKSPELSGSGPWETNPGAALSPWLSSRDWERGLLRLTPAAIGIRADESPFLWKGKDTVGWSGGRWALIFERKHLQRLELNQIEGSKGPAGSTLTLKLTNPFSLEHENQYYRLFDGADTDSLNDLADAVSIRWEMPLAIARFKNV